ncbi:hypothetical protein SAMN05444920_1223 [Nonomuraea solani]|uniref:Uncharacterized protein n=1 Tax=Nonomuraea solani TaxID=1144553 RepID=A0A1H6EYL3_9ACTN|nr:hypothetical protein [Nonomuraea solani]SEH01754.1 hypothetical protein SAMN05444920_1223 [Nonomuraea solani]
MAVLSFLDPVASAAGPARTADVPAPPERTLQDRLADLLAKHSKRR